ncbi:MAG: M23 family metallopeptidase [Thermoleophilia bacterium]|nr:M23 family metallopeptidase [Thermoleophilia bacterium]
MSPISAALSPAVAGGGAVPGAAAPTLDQAITSLAAAVDQLAAVVQQYARANGGGVQPAANAVAGATGGGANAAPTAVGQAQTGAAPAIVPAAPVAAPSPAPAAEKPIYPVPATHITDEFLATADRARPHSGLDLAQPSGTEIHASLSGKVVESKFSGDWGNTVVIAHPGNIFTRYAHLVEPGAAVGAEVKQGDVIGKVGSTGKSTGPHLHLSLYEGGLENANRRDPHVWLDSGTLTAERNPNASK